MPNAQEPIQSEFAGPGLDPLALALDLLHRIERGNDYVRLRKEAFRRGAVIMRIAAVALSVASTIILGLQDLDFWAGLGFALVAVATVVNTVEPFFAWRARWVLMEESQYRFYRLRDDVMYYIASTQPGQIEVEKVRELFDQYQKIWDDLSSRWQEYRRSGSATH
ncbi:SLATT domain-containing protein [Micromonospora sp. FIMYZ51]|uniref:SLATT domain-containing protein n=1 Tax=Micromonospora sp. FIMYZ51 TaxID=3051832 RepID=UPI00311D7451